MQEMRSSIIFLGAVLFRLSRHGDLEREILDGYTDSLHPQLQT